MAKSVKHHKKSTRRKTVKGGEEKSLLSSITSFISSKPKETVPETVPEYVTKTKVNDVVIHSSKNNLKNNILGFQIASKDDLKWSTMKILFKTKVKPELLFNYLTTLNRTQNIAQNISNGTIQKILKITNNHKVTISIIDKKLTIQICEKNCNLGGIDNAPAVNNNVVIPLSDIVEISFDEDINTTLDKMPQTGGKSKTRKNRHNKTRRV